MTNEELARVLNTLDFLKTNNPLYRHEINVAIHAVNILPKVEVITDHAEDIAKALESQPCEDAISRKRLIILIDEGAELHPYKVVGDSETYSDYNQGWTDAFDWLYANIDCDNLPSVKPQPKIDEIIKRIEETRDKDKIAEYPYNRCIKIIREVLE